MNSAAKPKKENKMAQIKNKEKVKKIVLGLVVLFLLLSLIVPLFLGF